jgi:hypothetical protein
MVSDDFNRANGPLGSNWFSAAVGIGGTGPPAILTNRCVGNVGEGSAYYSATNFANTQASSFLFVSTSFAAPAVRMQANAISWYAYFDNGSVQKCTEGTRVVIASFAGFSVGQRAKLTATGSTLEAFVNGVSVGTVVDTTYPTGAAGIAFVGSGATIDDWEGEGDLPREPVLWSPQQASVVIPRRHYVMVPSGFTPPPSTIG